MKMKLTPTLSAAAMALALLATPAAAVDLLARYPTHLTAGDAEPDHARPWAFDQGDIFRLSRFELKIGDKLKVEIAAADLGLGHCADGAVWAVLIPRQQGTLTSPIAGAAEPIANVWLRFHPAQLNRLFPPRTVAADGNPKLVAAIQSVSNAKFRSSWHAGQNAMIPEPQDLTVYVDTKGGAHRFFMVDTKAQTAEYAAAFNQQTPDSARITATSLPPVVIKTVPEAGSRDVPPGEFEIKVTFSKEMTDQSWSWCTVWDNSTPEGTGAPKYDADHRTCSMEVKLEPGTTYGYWLNTEKFQNFRDVQGHSAVPYLLAFSTTGQRQSQTGDQYLQQQLKLAQAGNYWAEFNLWEAYAQGQHDVAKNPVEAAKWLPELVKGAYLAKFEPVHGFNPKSPEEMLNQFSEQCHLFSGKDSLGGASFFRTTKQADKLIGSFLTATPDEFKAAIGQNPKLKLISMEKVTPEMFLAHAASPQESL